jgi:hypothetical protein
VEEELVERYDKQTALQLELNSKVKDGIRTLAINDIIYLLNETLQNHQIFESEIVNDALEAIS